MKTQLLSVLLGLSSTSLALLPASSLIVDEAPDHVRPYLLPKFLGRAVTLTEQQTIRFSVTAKSSGGAFSMIQHNGQTSDWNSALPHLHHHTTEHFYCSRGRFELWAQLGGDNSTAVQEARILNIGDFGTARPNTTHTFRVLNPDSQLKHVLEPAGFEGVFELYSQSDFDSPKMGAPFIPTSNETNPFKTPQTPATKAALAKLDLYTTDSFVPRNDLVNSSAGSTTMWHYEPATLPAEENPDPYFVAQSFGPKYLNSKNGYKLIQPLATATQAPNLTSGTITLSPRQPNMTADSVTLPNHFALMVEEGLLKVTVDRYEEVQMLEGDVVFIPEGTKWCYYATVPFTRFFYVNSGSEGLDTILLKDSSEWEYATYPAN